MEAVGVGEELGQFGPVGVVVEEHADHVVAPAGLEVRLTEVLEGEDFVGFGPERDAEPAVLAAEHVSDGRLADPPAHADPRPLLDAFGEAVDDETAQPGERARRSPRDVGPRRSVSHGAAGGLAARASGGVAGLGGPITPDGTVR